MTRFVTAIAVLLLTASAKADLVGSDLDLALTHTGMLGSDPVLGIGPTGGAYTYGTTGIFNGQLLGFHYGTWSVWSPSIVDTQPGEPVVWTMTLDLSDFDYENFADETATLEVTGLIEYADMSTVDVLVDDSSVLFELTALAEGGFALRWQVNDILTGNGQGPPADVVIAWSSSVPAPGALVCLCVAGMCSCRGRRRG